MVLRERELATLAREATMVEALESGKPLVVDSAMAAGVGEVWGRRLWWNWSETVVYGISREGRCASRRR